MNVSADGIYSSVTVMVIFRSRAWELPTSACSALSDCLNKDPYSQSLILNDAPGGGPGKIGDLND